MKPATRIISPEDYILSVLSPEDRLDAAFKVAREAFKGTIHNDIINCACGVIPAPYQVRDKLQRESRRRSCEGRKPLQRNWVPVYTGNPGFRVKPGMTIKEDKIFRCANIYDAQYNIRLRSPDPPKWVRLKKGGNLFDQKFIFLSHGETERLS